MSTTAACPEEQYVNIKIPESFLERMSAASESEIEIKFIDGHVELRSIKESESEDKTGNLISILKNPPEGLTDFREYEYEDID